MDQKITDLDISIGMTSSDLIPIVDSNGENKALHGSQVKDYVANEVVSDIDDVKAMISDAYDNTATYAVGDYCIYNNILYRCTTAISTPEDFNPAYWIETSIEAEILLKQSAIDEINTDFGNNVCKGRVKIRLTEITSNSVINITRTESLQTYLVIIRGNNVSSYYVGLITGYGVGATRNVIVELAKGNYIGTVSFLTDNLTLSISIASSSISASLNILVLPFYNDDTFTITKT